MPSFKSPLEIYKYLEKSNCKLCLKPSCMAFAAAVFSGEKQLKDCPLLDPQVLQDLEGSIGKYKTLEDEQKEMLAPLKKQAAALDFGKAAERLGAKLVNDSLAINILGKDFLVGPDGELRSECHINVWVQIPLLTYILKSKGIAVADDWITFRQLTDGVTFNQFFMRKCQDPLQRIIDDHTELFFDLLSMFKTKSIDDFKGADHSYLLSPLPKVPLVICYWEPEDELGSKLSIFFDKTADRNLTTHSLYLLGTGMVEMFKKLILTHHFDI